MKQQNNYNHLCRLPNTEENMAIVRFLRKMIKASDSRWQLVLKGRKPIDGKNYGYGGNLPLKYAKEFAIYIRPRKSVEDKERRQMHKRNMENWRNKNTVDKMVDILNGHIVRERNNRI